MNLYFELLQYPVFTVNTVNQYYNNVNSARSALKRLIKNGMVEKIRNNLYTCISGETNSPVANRFQIASNITNSSFVSHHSAMEYYGITDQVFYDVYVSSKTYFNDFEYDGYHYHCIVTDKEYGVNMLEYSGGIAITDKERTIVDSVKDMDKIAGMEEVIQNIDSINTIQENKMLKYMNMYNIQFLFQKIGFIFEMKSNVDGITKEFFEICKKNTGNSKRYFTKDMKKGHYVKEWRLVVPDNLKEIKNGGLFNADI